jgi:hypothetical protein
MLEAAEAGETPPALNREWTEALQAADARRLREAERLARAAQVRLASMLAAATVLVVTARLARALNRPKGEDGDGD